MEHLTPPKYVKQVLTTLEIEGFKAFLVGGCVRDMLLGRRPDDWDVCTDALPDEVLAAFPRAYPTGLKHGTVTVAIGKHRVEVTTFRSDGEYVAHRRPESVSFISDLRADLERRDFTINAIALPLSGLLIDPFGGREDLNARLIRCVGEPERRFDEDALRMFRAVRFSARLDFDIDGSTSDAIYACSQLAAFLAPERVCDELQKILSSQRPGMISRVMSYGLLDRYLLRSKTAVNLKRLARIPSNRTLRWAALCAALSSHRLIGSTEDFLRSLRLDNATIHACSGGVTIAMERLPSGNVEWKRLLASEGPEVAGCAAAAADMLNPSGCLRSLAAIRDSGECFSMKRLAVNGDDLLKLGMSGIELGRALKSLLDHVIEHPEDNEREKLLELISSAKFGENH